MGRRSVLDSGGKKRVVDSTSTQYDKLLNIKGGDCIVVHLVETVVRRPPDKHSYRHRLYPKRYKSDRSPISTSPDDGNGQADLARDRKDGSLRRNGKERGKLVTR